jgi:4'-phosphopantetheinyl transferase
MAKKLITSLTESSAESSLPRVSVFLVDTHKIELDTMLEQYKSFISADRMKKIIRLAHMSDKKLSFAAEMALCFAMKSFSLAYSPTAYKYDQWGKPYIENSEDVFISISHSGYLSSCAISHFPIAVDVLETDYYIASSFQKKVVGPKDIVPENKHDLLSLWTKKESYVKLTGRGLRTSTLSFSVDGNRVISHTGGPEAFIKSIESDGYFISLASDRMISADYYMLSTEDFPSLFD